MKMIAMAILINLLLGNAAVCGAGPTLKEALKLCEKERDLCIFAGKGSRLGSGVKSNPFYGGPVNYIAGGCDKNKETGNIDLPTWKKCRDWCEARHAKCARDAKRIFGP